MEGFNNFINCNNDSISLESTLELVTSDFDSVIALSKWALEANVINHPIVQRRLIQLNDINNNPVCSICGETFARNSSLKRHVEQVHSNKDGKYECTICKGKFDGAIRLSAHKRRAHGLSKDKPDPELKNRLPCALCKFTYASQQQLEKHMRNKHSIHKKTHSGMQYSCLVSC